LVLFFFASEITNSLDNSEALTGVSVDSQLYLTIY